jgi:hypothetical protein
MLMTTTFLEVRFRYPMSALANPSSFGLAQTRILGLRKVSFKVFFFSEKNDESFRGHSNNT